MNIQEGSLKKAVRTQEQKQKDIEEVIIYHKRLGGVQEISV